MPGRVLKRLDHTIETCIRGVRTQERVAQFFDAQGDQAKAETARKRLALTEQRLATVLAQRTLLYPPPR